jgi:hypothetical protein
VNEKWREDRKRISGRKKRENPEKPPWPGKNGGEGFAIVGYLGRKAQKKLKRLYVTRTKKARDQTGGGGGGFHQGTN